MPAVARGSGIVALTTAGVTIGLLFHGRAYAMFALLALAAALVALAQQTLP